MALLTFLLTLFALQSIQVEIGFAGLPKLSVEVVGKLGGRLDYLTPIDRNLTYQGIPSLRHVRHSWNVQEWSDVALKHQQRLNTFPNTPCAARSDLHMVCYLRDNNDLSKTPFQEDGRGVSPGRDSRKGLGEIAAVGAVQSNLSASRDRFAELFRKEGQDTRDLRADMAV